MENAVTSRACYQMARALAELYIVRRGEDGAPKKVLLDFDATDDPTHGDQRKRATITATSRSTSTTRSWSSMEIQASSSQLF
jgi:hypothetical protein